MCFPLFYMDTSIIFNSVFRAVEWTLVDIYWYFEPTFFLKIHDVPRTWGQILHSKRRQIAIRTRDITFQKTATCIITNLRTSDLQKLKFAWWRPWDQLLCFADPSDMSQSTLRLGSCVLLTVKYVPLRYISLTLPHSGQCLCCWYSKPFLDIN